MQTAEPGQLPDKPRTSRPPGAARTADLGQHVDALLAAIAIVFVTMSATLLCALGKLSAIQYMAMMGMNAPLGVRFTALFQRGALRRGDGGES